MHAPGDEEFRDGGVDEVHEQWHAGLVVAGVGLGEQTQQLGGLALAPGGSPDGAAEVTLQPRRSVTTNAGSACNKGLSVLGYSSVADTKGTFSPRGNF